MMQGAGRWQRRMRVSWFGTLAVLCALAVAISSVVPVPRAEAQQRPKTIVEMLFGPGTRADPPPRVIKKRVIRKKRATAKPKRTVTRKKRTSSRKSRSTTRKKASPTTRTRSAPAAAVAADAPSGEKDVNAETILVVGDFLADSLADGLKESYADDSLVAVTARTNGSSGLVREDFYDWSEKLGPIIDEVEPDVLAIMIGANDRQPMRVSGSILAVRSDGWTAEYEKRATDLAKIAKEKNVPLIWVGMPSFKYDSMSEDMVFFNDIYRRAAERGSGEFVRIWDGFVDEKGDFVYSGPDVNGQTVRLRGSDGLNMTDAGDEKLAFFTEKALARVLGDGPSQIALGDESLPTIQLQPLSNAANAQVAAPVALNDPSLDGSEALLGTGTGSTTFSLDLSPRDRLVLNGDQGSTRDGRADNFAWNAKSSAIRTDPPVVYRGSIDLKTINEKSGITPPEEMPSILDAIIADWTESANDSEATDGPPATAY